MNNLCLVIIVLFADSIPSAFSAGQECKSNTYCIAASKNRECCVRDALTTATTCQSVTTKLIFKTESSLLELKDWNQRNTLQHLTIALSALWHHNIQDLYVNENDCSKYNLALGYLRNACSHQECLRKSNNTECCLYSNNKKAKCFNPGEPIIRLSLVGTGLKLSDLTEVPEGPGHMCGYDLNESMCYNVAVIYDTIMTCPKPKGR